MPSKKREKLAYNYWRLPDQKVTTDRDIEKEKFLSDIARLANRFNYKHDIQSQPWDGDDTFQEMVLAFLEGRNMTEAATRAWLTDLATSRVLRPYGKRAKIHKSKFLKIDLEHEKRMAEALGYDVKSWMTFYREKNHKQLNADIGSTKRSARYSLKQKTKQTDDDNGWPDSGFKDIEVFWQQEFVGSAPIPSPPVAAEGIVDGFCPWYSPKLSRVLYEEGTYFCEDDDCRFTVLTREALNEI
ncbi:MAG: hypothetical protein ACYTBV_09970 [Planctomycetota bacterium]|jgi:DNA-directed RNA polymerase specialized sigma24 family protein